MSNILSELTPAQIDVLLVVASADEWATRRSVTEGYRIRRNTMSNPNDYLKTLVSRGYIEKRENDDGNDIYRLAPVGREVLWNLRDELTDVLESDE